MVSQEEEQCFLQKLTLDDHELEAFWSKIDSSTGDKSCWEWRGAKNRHGYGNLRLRKKYVSAHRVVWELLNFKINKDFVILHLCDNPSCCNPTHLALGTKKSNTFDMIHKGRDGFKKNKAVGVRNTNAKLTDNDVLQIRAHFDSGVFTQDELACRYGVTQTTISCVLLRKTWRHI